MDEHEPGPSSEDLRRDQIETMALELSYDPRVKEIVDRAALSGRRSAAFKELRLLLTQDGFEDYKERISQIPVPVREDDPTSIHVESNRVQHIFASPSNEFNVVNQVVGMLYPKPEQDKK